MEHPKRWQEGDRVELPKVTPYTIVKLVGEAGNIHIDERGYFHSFWHRELQDGTTVLRHSGGQGGFPDLDTIKREHERVILYYVGLKVDLTSEIAPLNFVDAADSLQLEFPGEQQLVSSWILTLQKVTRDLPTLRGVGALGSVRDPLLKLLEGKLSRGLNRHKRQAAQALREGVVHAVQTNYPQELLERRVYYDILHEKVGVFGRLSELKGQPYKAKAQQFINSKNKVFQLWEGRNLENFAAVLGEEAKEAEIWKRRVREVEMGVDFGKYALN